MCSQDNTAGKSKGIQWKHKGRAAELNEGGG